MLLKNRWMLLFLTGATMVGSMNVWASSPAVQATPSVYKVTVSDVGFSASVGLTPGMKTPAFTSFASGDAGFDIASAAAGEALGSFSQNGTLPPGTYGQMRFNVSKTMQLKGQTNGNLSNGKPCRTTSASTSVSDPFGNGSVSIAYLGSTDGGEPQVETVTIPSGSLVTLPAGFTDQGTYLQGTVTANLTVAEGVPFPEVKIAFNVTDAMYFAPYGADNCVVFPGAPSVNISVNA